MALSMVAAGFTAGEADELRRAMAAWRRKGGIGPFERKLIDGMLARGYSEEFALALFRQLEGFAEYGFPESHAASFALLVYASAWLKRHHPACFLAGLLNSQPMGFYAPAQLVREARRQGVDVRAVDIRHSDWDCTLEALDPRERPAGMAHPAVRLGLRQISGLRREAAERIVAARRQRPFASVADLVARARLDPVSARLLAEGDALAGLAGHRREAAWATSGIVVQRDLFDGIAPDEPGAQLAAPTEGENIAADYGRVGLTLGRHPLALLRRHLSARRFIEAAAANALADRALARVAGLVTCRQRPGTASGIVFITMEDETAITNVVLHPELVARQRREVLGASLLGVYGQMQREGAVVHLIARRLIDLSPLLGSLAVASRDFH